MRLATETIQDVIIATAVLHNVARDQNEEEPRVEMEVLEDVVNDEHIVVDQHAKLGDNALRT